MDEYIEEDIILADDIRKFFKTRIGQYLLTRIEEEIAESTEILTSININTPTATQEFQTAQNRLNVAKSVEQWLGQAIVAGNNAESIYFGENQ